MYDVGVIVGFFLAVSTTAYAKYKGFYDNLMMYSILLLMSALVLAILPPPGIVVPLPEGYLVVSLPMIFELLGVLLLMIALTPQLGAKKTIALATVIYAIAVVGDAIIYFGELTHKALLSSLLVNSIVYIPSVIAILVVSHKLKHY